MKQVRASLMIIMLFSLIIFSGCSDKNTSGQVIGATTTTLSGSFGKISVNSVPNARLFIDGTMRCITPCNVSVATGSHNLLLVHNSSLSRPQYMNLSTTVNVAQNATVNLELYPQPYSYCVNWSGNNITPNPDRIGNGPWIIVNNCISCGLYVGETIARCNNCSNGICYSFVNSTTSNCIDLDKGPRNSTIFSYSIEMINSAQVINNDKCSGRLLYEATCKVGTTRAVDPITCNNTCRNGICS